MTSLPHKCECYFNQQYKLIMSYFVWCILRLSYKAELAIAIFVCFPAMWHLIKQLSRLAMISARYLIIMWLYWKVMPENIDTPDVLMFILGLAHIFYQWRSFITILKISFWRTVNQWVTTKSLGTENDSFISKLMRRKAT